MPLQQAIANLSGVFQARPDDFFHERELHAAFFNLARAGAGHAVTRDGFDIHRLRYEYETIWRYKKTGAQFPYRQRYPEHGENPVGATTATIDFALLHEQFIAEHELVTVINKCEQCRVTLRQMSDGLWPSDKLSVAIEAALEFKMAHRRDQMSIGKGRINELREGMALDCRKLARERPPRSFVIGFSHGTAPIQSEAANLVNACIKEFQESYDGPLGIILRVAIITPFVTYLSSNWDNPAAFGNQVVPQL